MYGVQVWAKNNMGYGVSYGRDIMGFGADFPATRNEQWWIQKSMGYNSVWRLTVVGVDCIGQLGCETMMALWRQRKDGALIENTMISFL